MKIIAFLVFSNIYVALPVVCLALQTTLQFDLEIEPLFFTFIYSATLFSYCFHRLFPFNKKEISSLSERHIWIADNKSSFTLVVVFSIVVCVASFTFLKEGVFYLLIPAGFLTLFYTVPFLKFGGRWIRLRNLPFLKLFLVSFTVSYVSVVLPYLYNNPERNLLTLEVLLVSVERFFFLLAITIPFDIRDINYDQKTGLKTIPGVLGVRNSIHLSYFSIAIFLVISVIHYLFIQEHFALAIAMISSGTLTAIFVSRATPIKSEYFFSLLIEGTMILQFLLVYLVFLTR